MTEEIKKLDTMPKLDSGLMRLPEKEGKIDIEHVCHIPSM